MVLASDEAIGEGGDALAIGISYAGAQQTPEIVDGVAVSAQVEVGLDIVARATGDGAQVLAVLAAEDAPTQLAFDLDLAQGATLEPLQDGSIAVFAPVETEVPLPGEQARVEAAVAEILGGDIVSLDDLDELDAISDEQFEQLAEIPDVQTKTVTSTQQVAQVEAPWAVDAEGNAVETSYNLVDGTLTQTVVTDKNTAFPVVADPSLDWWVATIGMCAVQVAITFVPGSVLIRAAKFAKKVSSLATKSKPIAAAVKRLGGATKAAVAMIKKKVGEFRDKLIAKGQSISVNQPSKSVKKKVGEALIKAGEKIKKPQLSAKVQADLRVVEAFSIETVFDHIGYGSCGQLLRQAI